MRLLFVGTNAGGGGTESHFISLARALAELGHEVSAVVRPHDFIHRGLAHDPRIRIYPAEFRGRYDIRTMRRVSRIARAVRPDWVVGMFAREYWGVAFAAKAAGVPLALFSHVDRHTRPLLLNPYFRLARVVIVPSQYLRQRKTERGLPEERVAVLGNPIDVDRFRASESVRAATRATLGIRPDDMLVGFVGRFERAKGVATLERALEQAMKRDARLHALWVGHGNFENELRVRVDASGFAARHHWMPWLDDVLPAYTAMDLLALPSEGSETFGRVLVEAQSCGVPVLGARSGGIPEALLDNETGRLVPPGDVMAWGDAISDLCENDVARYRYASAARDFAIRFDSQRIAKEFLCVLDSFATPAETIAAGSNAKALQTMRQ